MNEVRFIFPFLVQSKTFEEEGKNVGIMIVRYDENFILF